MLDEVRYLYEQGYSLIPLNGKAAAVPWAEYQTKRASWETVEKWFSSKAFNVGIITGKVSNLVVIDIDPRNGGSVAETISKYPTDCYVLTGSGGAHLYYSHPGSDATVSNIHPTPGIDIKGDGGYVVAPPSIHPETKQPYKWVNKGKLKLFPKEVMGTTAVHEPKPDANSWLSSLLEFGAADGNKNTSMSSISGYFASKGIPEDVTVAMMKLWNQRNSTKLSVKEIETTVSSVYETALRRKPVPEYADVHKGEETENLGGKGFTLTGFEEYMKIYGDMPVDWIIPGWMPDATICFLVSPPGSYKSWLLYDLAVSTAMGGKFLGQYQVRLPGPVFLVQQEDHHGQTAQRIEVIRRSKVQEAMEQSTDNESDITYDMPKTMPLFVHTDRQLKFDSKEAVKDLCAAIEKYRPKLVIIDPLYSAASTDDYMNKAIDSMFFLKDMRDKFGTTFIIAHHSNKSEREDRMRAWGSQFLNAFLETGWQIFKQSDKSIVVKRHFKIAGNPEETCLTFDINTETGFYYKVKEGLVKAKRDKKTEIVHEELDSIREEKEEEAKALQEDMNKLSKKIPKPDSPAILNFLLSQPEYVTKNQVIKHFGNEQWRDWISSVLESMANNQLVEYKYYANAKLGWQHQYRAHKKR